VATLAYFRPRTLSEAVTALASSGGQILAGGTDFYPALGDGPVRTPVVDITAVPEIQTIEIFPSEIHIGGGVTWTRVLAAALPRAFDALKLAAREVGSVQIQNRGTVAGNLCNASPAADGIPPLLALDAEVELVSPAGTRRMPLDNFVLGNRKTERKPGEILARVIVPRAHERAASAFLKLGARRYLVISISMVAVILATGEDGKVSAARIAVGSCAARAQRLRELERDLVGQKARPGLGRLVATKHLAPLSPIDDIRSTAEYRRDASLTLIRRAIEACISS
jgi:CO/xanthine dehydrogenase FAD-binding subunit